MFIFQFFFYIIFKILRTASNTELYFSYDFMNVIDKDNFFC